MAEQWRIRRGTNTENNAFTGALGEVTMDIDRNEVRLHDGSTMGGKVLGRDYKTNCITEIPQDINLELAADGTLTLKAGSKVYVPNGAGVFDTYTAANDISSNSFAGSVTRFVFIDINNNTINAASTVFSGTTAPTLSGVGFWYDTTNNVIKRTTDSSATWTTGYSFPIAIVTSISDVATSIDQVFNGFSYIGSTVFALPGLEYLCPNGRNSDGTLKNTKNKLTTCVVRTETNTSFNGKRVINITAGGTIVFDSLERWFVQEQEPLRTNYNIWENPATNEMYQYLDGVWNKRTSCVLGITTETAGKIDSFSRKQVFRVVDYSDTEYIAHQAMPSDKYIDLTLGANGSSYTAPADGYVYLWKVSNAADQYITLTNRSNGLAIHQWTPLNGGGCAGYIPVSKGDIVDYTYTAGGAVNIFRFIYANGAK